MDLRKSVLIKQVLSESTLNTSNISAYESAAEDNDTTLYYSFTNDSSKSFDISAIAADDSELNNSTCSNDDKENTIIQQRQSIQTETALLAAKANTTACESKLNEEEVRENLENSSPVNIVQNKSTARVSSAMVKNDKVQEVIDKEKHHLLAEQVVNEEEIVSESIEAAAATANPQIIDDISPPPALVGTTFDDVLDVMEVEPVNIEQSSETKHKQTSVELLPGQEVNVEEVTQQNAPTTGIIFAPRSLAPPELLTDVLITVNSPMVEDTNPNENIVNPFTSSSSMQVAEQPLAIVKPAVIILEKRVTRRSVVSIKIPSKTFLYSPVIRRSIDRKGKPPPARRTILQHENKAGPSKSSGSVKTSTVISKLVMVKPKTYKCSVAACFNQEFPTMKAYQDHQKTHRGANVAATKSSFNCKWCDKKFQLENALINHQTENCAKIPAVEKRKVLSKSDKHEKDRRRTTLFAPPMPTLKRKSPMRRPVTDMNRSGIKITPKKSLKCHLCSEIVNDAVSLANHILTHKFNRDNGIVG